MHQPSLSAALRASARQASWLTIGQISINVVESEGCRAEAKRRRAMPSQIQMQFFFVYILQSESSTSRFYVGLTDDLRSRLKKHNNGDVPHTAKFRPWKIKTAIAFTDRERASQFEVYLKTASGRAFAKKRL